MHHFFIAPELLKTGNTLLILPEKLSHQVKDVLHLTIGEQMILLDNSGAEVLCSIVKSGRAGVEVEVLERYAGKGESPIRIILCQGLLKSARFEWILEKGTELGIATFLPVLCRRSMAGLEDAGANKIQRWQRIVQEATEQCGRARMPELLPIRSLAHALAHIPLGALALIPWEEEQKLSLRDALRNAITARNEVARQDPLIVVLFIGPEGGLLAEEVELARSHGVLPVTLGPRILRAETAALVAAANVMYELERV
jgi:16S rRNA (uracil1498-N3)-methyltransferase